METEPPIWRRLCVSGETTCSPLGFATANASRVRFSHPAKEAIFSGARSRRRPWEKGRGARVVTLDAPPMRGYL